MHVAVIRFPGSNCDDDVKHVLDRVIPESAARMVWHKDAGLGAADAVVVPGGCSEHSSGGLADSKGLP